MTVIETRVQALAALAIAPDGRTLAAAGWGENGGLWSLTDGGLVRRVPELARATCLAFSADGRRLVGVAGTAVVTVDARLRVAVTPITDAIASPAVAASPSGRTVVAVGTPRPRGRQRPRVRLCRLDRPGGGDWRRRWAVPVGYGLAGRAAVAPAGRLVAVADGAAGTATVHDGATGRRVRTLPVPGVVGVRFDGGRLLAFSRSHLWAWRVGDWDRPPLEVYGGPRERLDAVAVHPDRRRAFATNFDTSVLVIDLHTGAVGRTMDWRVPLLGAVAVSPDGTLAAAANHGGTVVVWDADG
jgi:WD40 repeat protein